LSSPRLILFLSSESANQSPREEQDLIPSYALGANSYVRKPVDFAEFQKTVRVLGIYWLMTNEPPPERNTS
jgi:two-component system response regulator